MSGTEIRRETWTRAGHTIDDQFAEILALQVERDAWEQLALETIARLQTSIELTDQYQQELERSNRSHDETLHLLKESIANVRALIATRDELREALRKV